MAFRLRPEHCDVVRPLHGVEPRIQRIVVAVGQKNADAEPVQPFATVAQAKLGFDAVVFLIIDVAGQHQEVGLFRLTEAEQALQSREGGVMQQARQVPPLGSLARKSLKGRVQMQIGRVDVADGVHAQSLACGCIESGTRKNNRESLDFFKHYDKRDNSWRHSFLQ